MKIAIKTLLLLIMLLPSYIVLSTNYNENMLAISAQAKAFSKAFVDGDIETIMAIYSPNAKIIYGSVLEIFTWNVLTKNIRIVTATKSYGLAL